MIFFISFSFMCSTRTWRLRPNEAERLGLLFGIAAAAAFRFGLVGMSAAPSRVGDRLERRLLPEFVRAEPVPRLGRLELPLEVSRRGTSSAAAVGAVATARLVRLDEFVLVIAPSPRGVLGADRLEERVEGDFGGQRGSPASPRVVVSVSSATLETRRCLRLDGDLGSSPLLFLLTPSPLLVLVTAPLLRREVLGSFLPASSPEGSCCLRDVSSGTSAIACRVSLEL
jgi:hypothetical protein